MREPTLLSICSSLQVHSQISSLSIFKGELCVSACSHTHIMCTLLCTLYTQHVKGHYSQNSGYNFVLVKIFTLTTDLEGGEKKGRGGDLEACMPRLRSHKSPPLRVSGSSF